MRQGDPRSVPGPLAFLTEAQAEGPESPSNVIVHLNSPISEGPSRVTLTFPTEGRLSNVEAIVEALAAAETITSLRAYTLSVKSVGEE